MYRLPFAAIMRICLRLWNTHSGWCSNHAKIYRSSSPIYPWAIHKHPKQQPTRRRPLIRPHPDRPGSELSSIFYLCIWRTWPYRNRQRKGKVWIERSWSTTIIIPASTSSIYKFFKIIYFIIFWKSNRLEMTTEKWPFVTTQNWPSWLKNDLGTWTK